MKERIRPHAVIKISALTIKNHIREKNIYEIILLPIASASDGKLRKNATAMQKMYKVYKAGKMRLIRRL
jgi:hypothetical protein